MAVLCRPVTDQEREKAEKSQWGKVGNGMFMAMKRSESGTIF